MSNWSSTEVRRASHVTRAAEGLPRRRFTVAEVESMIAAGVMDADERVELIGGEFVPMAAESRWHEDVKIALCRHWAPFASAGCELKVEAPIRLSTDTLLAPDLTLRPTTLDAGAAKPEDVWLVVEITETSRRYDLGRKPRIYARHGVRELWVIDARTMSTRTFREPHANGYAAISDFNFDETVIPVIAPPQFALRFDTLEPA